MLLTPFFNTLSTESIIFPGSMSRDCAHFTTSGLFPNTLSIHFWKTGIFSSIFFPIFTKVAPSSGTTTSMTITIIQITKQIESTRLTGLASFWAVFFSCFNAFPNRWCSMNFIGILRIKAIPKPMMNGKRKPSRTLAVPMTMCRFWTPRYKRIANAMSHRIFFMFSLSSCMFVFPFFLILESIISYFPKNGRLEKYFICYAVSASKRF